MTIPLHPRPLRELVYDRLLEEIVEGRREPRVRIKDTELAESLGVSRTPVREALLRLAKEGFLRADHQRGFRVADFDPVEVRETYPIIAALEVAGMRLAHPYEPRALERLRAANASLGSAHGFPRRLRWDQEWHRALVEPAGNARLLRALATHKTVVRRYENHYMESVERVLGSVEEHERILSTLEAGNIDRASRRLERHWARGMEQVLEWIER